MRNLCIAVLLFLLCSCEKKPTEFDAGLVPGIYSSHSEILVFKDSNWIIESTVPAGFYSSRSTYDTEIMARTGGGFTIHFPASSQELPAKLDVEIIRTGKLDENTFKAYAKLIEDEIYIDTIAMIDDPWNYNGFKHADWTPTVYYHISVKSKQDDNRIIRTFGTKY